MPENVISDNTVAVIVPVFNEVRMLPTLIEQLQRLKADALIIVDGGSNDGSREILQKSGLHWIQSKPGRAAQMNAGANASNSDILLFIHADTGIDLSHISMLREAMKDGAAAGGRFDIRLSGDRVSFRVIEWFINLRSRLSKICTGDQCQFVRRSRFKQMGGFSDQPLMEDIEFSKRLKRIGRVISLRQTVTTSSRRWEQHGIIRTVWLMWKLRLLYWLGVSPQQLVHIYRDVR